MKRIMVIVVLLVIVLTLMGDILIMQNDLDTRQARISALQEYIANGMYGSGKWNIRDAHQTQEKKFFAEFIARRAKQLEESGG